MADFFENIDYVTCKVCGNSYKRLSGSHLKLHNLTLEKYREVYPDAVVISENSFKLKSLKARTSPRREYRKWSVESRQKLKKIRQKFFASEKGVEMVKKQVKKRELTICEANEKRSRTLKTFWASPEGKILIENMVVKREKSMKASNKKRRATMLTKVGKIREKKEYWENLQKGLKLRPNKFEQEVARLLPEKFQYTGDFNPNGMFKFLDGRNKNADFTMFPERTKVVECFGDYWHGVRLNNITKEEHEADVYDNYKAIGVECLIIWQHELKDLENVQERINQFLLKKLKMEIFK